MPMRFASSILLTSCLLLTCGGVFGMACAQGNPSGYDPFQVPEEAGEDAAVGDEPGDDALEEASSDGSVDSPSDASGDKPVNDVTGDPVTDPKFEEAAIEAGPCTVCDQAGCGTCPTVATIPMGGQRIDSIEVTNEQYAAWLATNPKLSNQIATCSGNASFAPSKDWPVTGKDSYPVSNVDWCDAYAFCTWAKKRLCGKINGGENAYADYMDAAKSQWYKACTGGGVKTFPYGSSYVGTNCNGADYGAGDKLGAGQASNCQGAYPGLFDMSGNVWEWEDSCDTGNLCRIRGGSYTNNSNALDCAVDSSLPRTTTAPNVGFRCCSD